MEVATRLVAASPHGMLDRLFEEICECVQLTDTQFELAQSHYYAVGEWLAADDSPLAIHKPRIYPQGSARHKTTVKPIARQEHDVDLVCHLDLPYGTFSDPRTVFELVAMRLRQNGRYKDKLENYKRCIRLNYASEFHLDITPARPDPLRGGQCILVPDRKILRWKESNPVGFADWFDKQARLMQTARYAKEIESLAEQESAQQKAPLRRAVQLMKRHRDCTFGDDPEAPRSIVLTTLAGQHYAGEQLVSDALVGIIDRIIGQVESTRGIIEVPNPANSPEKFCEAWAGSPRAYRKFVDYLFNFRSCVRTLLTTHGVPAIAEGLNQLFGESLTKRAVASFTERFERDRQAGLIGFRKNDVGLMVTPASAPLVGRLVPRNTFHGVLPTADG